ncbi:MAG: protein disulfide oxidoreductase [bacterium]|nr:MAG: protein disulfide oxidoreductase [bacterium]
MGLLSPQDEVVLKQHLSAITMPVQVLLFTQAFGGSESGPVAKQIVNEVAALNGKITVIEKNFVLDLEDKAKYKIDKAPAIVILSDDVDTRMRMYGAPTGYEFVGLVEAILVAGTGKIDFEPETMAWVQAVTTPTHRGHRVHGPEPQVPRDRRPEDDRQRDHRDPGRPAGTGLRPRRAGLAGDLLTTNDATRLTARGAPP